MKKSANPRRQLGQYRLMIERQRKVVRWSTLFWLVPLLLVAFAYAMDAHWLVKTFLGIALLSGAVQQFNELGRLRDYEEKQRTLESNSE